MILFITTAVETSNPTQNYFYMNTFSSFNSTMKTRDSSVGIATGYGLDDRGVGIRVPVVAKFLFWGPPSLLSNGYRGLFLRG
jgi:hypothetical protein